MHRLLRLVLVVALLASVATLVGGAQRAAAQGQVYQDSMDSSATGLLSSQSPDPTRFVYGYQNSQFIIQSLEQGWSGDLLAFANVPTSPDVSVKIDFSIAGDLNGKYAFVGCRAGDDDTAYMFEVHPDTGQANIWRFDPGNAVNLASVTDTSVVTVGSANNTVEIKCQGSTITGIANGTQLLTAQDATYTSGDPFIGTGKNDATTDLLLTGFDNLVITDLGAGAAVQPTQAPVQPTQAPAQPTVQVPPAQPTQAPLQPTTQAPPVQPTTGTAVDEVPMVAYTDPTVDPAATLSNAFFMTLAQGPVFKSNGANGDLTSASPQYLSAGVNLTDFYARLSFITPVSDPAGLWTFGFCFWADASGNCYDLFVSSNGTNMNWGLGIWSPGGFDLAQSGPLPAGAIDLTPGAENDVTVAVYKGVAMLSSNTYELDTSFTVPGQPFGGDIKASTSFIASVETDLRTLPVSITFVGIWDMSSGVYPDFLGLTETPVDQPSVQPTTQAPVQPTQASAQTTSPSTTGAADPVLSQMFDTTRAAALATAPLFTSASGVLTQSTDGFSVVQGGVSVANFYATATFTNPTDMATRTDMGIGFRDMLDNQEFRFIIQSDGVWGLTTGASSVVVQGTVTNVNTTPGASNTIEIVAQGTTGIIAVNGVVVQQVDLSGNLNTGDVYIASGMLVPNVVGGRQVLYSNFSVYALPA